MKARKYLFKAIMILIILIIQHASEARNTSEDVELKKYFNKEYPCDIHTGVEISNKYGKIDITTWDRPFVKIDVTVIVKAGSKSKAQAKLDEISVKMDKTGNSIVAVTEFDSNNSSWWSGWWSWNNNVNIEINYQVQMPSNLNTILENKYGNIYLPDLKGKTSINLKYGNLEGRNIENDLLLDLSYGKTTIGNVENLTGHISYSDYRGVKANVVILTSKYSKVYVDNASLITATSKYDTYKLGNVGTLTMTGAYDDIEIKNLDSGALTAKYSGVEINSLGKILSLDISYGSLLLENLMTSLKSISINTSYAPVKIYGTVPSKVEVQGKYFDVSLGSDFIQKFKEISGNSTHIKGFKISEKANATINITSKYGDIYLK